MELVKNLSVAIATAGFIVVAAAEAKAVSLEFDQTFGNTGGAGQLNLPQGIDVQEETGNVYQTWGFGGAIVPHPHSVEVE